MNLPQFNGPLYLRHKVVLVLCLTLLVVYGYWIATEPAGFWHAFSEAFLAFTIADVLWVGLLVGVPSAIYHWLPAGEITTGVLVMCSFAALDLAAVHVIPIRNEPLLEGAYDMWFGILFVWYWHKKGVIDWTPDESAA